MEDEIELCDECGHDVNLRLQIEDLQNLNVLLNEELKVLQLREAKLSGWIEIIYRHVTEWPGDGLADELQDLRTEMLSK